MEVNPGQHMMLKSVLYSYALSNKLIGLPRTPAGHQTQLCFLYCLLTMITMPRQHRLSWLGYVRRMKNGRILENILCGELIFDKRNFGHPQLLYRDM